MNASSQIDEPHSRGNGDCDLVTLPDRHTKSAAIDQKAHQ